MPSLLVVCPNQKDATSFYRGMGPLGRLRKQISNLHLSFSSEYNWATLGLSDAIFVQRPYTNNHYHLLEIAKNCQVPIWVDYDDDLFSVPSDNPTFMTYGNQDTQRTIAKCLAIADVVTVSTNHLKQKLSKANSNIVVIPNAFDEQLFNYRNLQERQLPLVMWRGSNTHQRDLMNFSAEMIEISRRSKWSWSFIGYHPWFLTDFMPEKLTKVVEALDVVQYHKFIHDCRAAIQIVPLADMEFNRSKSNIAAIEGTFAGSACLAPDWEQWRMPGMITYKTQEDFQTALSAMMKGDLDLQRMNKETWTFIMDTLTLSKVNRLRMNLLEDLFSRRKEPGFFGSFKI